jgi:pimeloyl-ACP methyl ester carboxylesterase
MQYITLQHGGRLAYTRHEGGSGTPCMLLHGFCENQEVWHHILPFLDTCDCYTVDLPGFGQSDPLPQPGMEHYAAAIGALIEALSLKEYVLIGHSLGGYVALEMADDPSFNVQHSSLKGLGLVHSHPFTDDAARLEGRQRGLALVEGGKQDLFVSQLFPGLFTPNFAQNFGYVVDTLIDNAKAGPTEGIAMAIKSMMQRRDHTATLRNLHCPVLFALGEADTLIPAEMVQAMIHLPEVAHIHIGEGVAHMGMYENPTWLGEAVKGFGCLGV